MKQIRESDHFKRKKRQNQNTPTLKKITKIIKTKQSKTKERKKETKKQTNNQINKQPSKQTNQQTQICTYFRIQLWYVHRIGGVMVSIQRL